jgi:hypothetical protein
MSLARKLTRDIFRDMNSWMGRRLKNQRLPDCTPYFNHSLGHIEGAQLSNPGRSLPGVVCKELREIRRDDRERAASLSRSRQLFTLSRDQVDLVEIIDLNSALSQSAKMIRQNLGEPSEVVLNLSSEPCLINAPRWQCSRFS